MAGSISTLGQQMTLINRVKAIQTNMAGYQGQITTGFKHDNFKDYGPEALRIQRYRSDLLGIDGYLFNIDNTQVNIEQMNSAIDENIKQAGNILTAITVQLAKGSEFDLESIKGAAQTALQIVESNMNAKIGDRYLFAGSDVNNKPFSNSAAGDANIQTRISDWMNGTTDTTAFLASLDGMTDSQSGYSTGLQSAEKVYARADDGFEIDYTVLANGEGFKKVVNGLRTLANMNFPTDTDVPTKDEFYTALNAVYATVQQGVQGMRADATKIASAAQALETVKQDHLNDRQNLQKVLETTEGADVSDAVIRFQTLQTQMQASYQVTATLSQLSLVNFLGN